MRPRTKDRHLPKCVYLRHGAFWLVKRGAWTRLGEHWPGDARDEYDRLMGGRNSPGIGRYVDDALAAHHKEHPLAPSTLRLYKLAGEKIKFGFAEFRSPDQVKQKHIALFKRGLVDTPGIANHCLSVLRIVFNYLLEEQLVDSNPAIAVKRITQKPRERLISRAEFDAIRSKAVPRLQVMMDLMYLTGQRLMDVVGIREQQIGNEGIYFKQAKTDKRLVVSWTPEIRAAVAQARALNGIARSLTLFRGRRGTPPKYKSVYVQWRAACALAGVEDAQGRDLRAMSATEVQQQDGNAQALLGHSTQATTNRYLRSKIVPVVAGPSGVLDMSKKNG